MKTLVNKNNPAIKIIADTLLSDSFNYITGFCSVPKSDWTLVEEEPKKVNCPFDKGNCNYCTVQFCGAREESPIETHSTAEEEDFEKRLALYIQQRARLDEEIGNFAVELNKLRKNESKETSTSLYQQTARHFYYFGKEEGINENNTLKKIKK